MKVYTYSEARQRLASLLDESRREGQVQIRRRDGQVFLLQPVAETRSPLEVPAVRARLRPGELEGLVREARASGDRFWSETPRDLPAQPVRPPRPRSGGQSPATLTRTRRRSTRPA